MRTNIIIGAGFSGATIANLIAAKLNEKVFVIDKKIHIAGNCYDYRDNDGILIQKYGSHIFHTNNENVWNFLNQFTRFNNYTHEVVAKIDNIEAHLPFNFNTLYQVFPQSTAKKLELKLITKFDYNSKIPILEFQNQNDEDLKFLANYIYEKIFLNYTTKQWGISPQEIDKSILSRVPVYLSKDNRYFQDKYQGIPVNGYTKTIEKMLANPNITVVLNTDYKDFKKNHTDLFNNDTRIFCTGPIDEFFDYKYGQLPYRSLKFEFETFDKEFYQSHACINYPNNYDFTRIHEYKYYLRDKSDKTVIAKEYPQTFEPGKNDRYYPIPNVKNNNLYTKYKEESNKINNLYFLGRLGDYKYYNIDGAINRALKLFDELYK